MSIEKSISPTLSNLIAEANFTIGSVKEKILAAYNYAIEKDGYTPQEANKLLKEKLEFSKSYVNQVLPLEAKDQSKIKISLQDKDKDDPLVDHHGLNNSSSENEDFKKFRDDKGSSTPEIKTAYEFLEAESESIPPNEEKEINEMELPKNEIPPHIILQLQQLETVQQRLKEVLARNEELETKLQDKAFDVINNTKDSVRNGIYDLEVKDRIIPLKWNFSLLNNRMVIELDVARARRMGI